MIQQIIQEVKFENIILEKAKRVALKNNKIRNWLEYLKMLDENHQFSQKNLAIREMHIQFILNEEFWLRESQRVFSTTANSQKQIIEQFEFAFLALEDGFYFGVARLISQQVKSLFIQGKIRQNYAVAQLEILLQKFKGLLHKCREIMSDLRQIYAITGQEEKVREVYKRQIRSGHQQFDMVYAAYCQWEKQRTDLKQIQSQLSQLFQQGQKNWNLNQITEEEIRELTEETQMGAFIKSTLNHSNSRIQFIVRTVEHQGKKLLTPQLLSLLLSGIKNPKEKIWYLRRAALQPPHYLVQQYLWALEKQAQEQSSFISNNQQQIGSSLKNLINIYPVVLKWPGFQTFEMPYLQFLVRRFNKHVYQSQNEYYNARWGENVQFFRTQVSRLIEKYLNPSKETLLRRSKLYYYWIEVQKSLVKDADAVAQIFENFLKEDSSLQVYIQFAECMTQMGDIRKASTIYKRTIKSHSEDPNLRQLYQIFLSIYGNLTEVIQFSQGACLYKAREGNQELQDQLRNQPHCLTKNKIERSAQKDQALITQRRSEAQTKKKVYKSQHTEPAKEQSKNVKGEDLTNAQKSMRLTKKIPNQSVKSSQNQTDCLSAQYKRQWPQFQSLMSGRNEGHKKVHTQQVLQKNSILFVSGFPESWGQQQIRKNLLYPGETTQIRVIKKNGTTVCYVQYQNSERAEKELTQNKNQNIKLALSQPPAENNNKRTMFLCNLPSDVSRQNIISLIKEHGFHDKLKDVRIKKKSDKSFAYVEFEDEEQKDSAINHFKRQKISYENRSLIAMNCDSHLSQHKEQKSRTIFLKNLSFKCKQEDLRKFFESEGRGFTSGVKNVHIPKNEKGDSRGFAYIEFHSHKDWKTALDLKSGRVCGRQFEIVKSDRSISKAEEEKIKSKYRQSREPRTADSKKSNSQFSKLFS